MTFKRYLHIILLLVSACPRVFALQDINYYISVSLLTNLHSSRVYYSFADNSSFNYHIRPDNPSEGYYEENSVYTNFTADRFNKAQYSISLLMSYGRQDYFLAVESSLVDGRATFPLMGGTFSESSNTAYLLEKDVWGYTRINHGISLKGIIRDLGPIKLYWVLGIDYLMMDFDIIRHNYTFKEDQVFRTAQWIRKSYSDFGINAFIESNYLIYKEMRLFIKIGYKYYRDRVFRIETGPVFQHSGVDFNPSSVSFQIGIIHKL